MTPDPWGASDACAFRFEAASALAVANAGAGSAVPPARSMAFAARQLGPSRATRWISLEVMMAPPPTQAFAAGVGLYWADTTQAVCLQVAGADPRAPRAVAHTPEAIKTWACTRRHRFGGQPLAVCLEVATGPLVSARRAHDFWVRCPVSALTGATDRAACTPRRAQDDPPEAEIQRAGLRKHRAKLPRLTPTSAPRRPRDKGVEFRRRLVEAKVRLTNRRTSALKHYCPRVLPWFAANDTTIFCDFLTPWPTLKAVHLARRATIERFLRQHHVQTRLIAPGLEAIQTAMPRTTDAGIITPHVGLDRATLQAIEAFEHAIAPLAPTPPDVARFPALPGAGLVFAPRLRVAFGEQRDRYACATDLQESAGIALQ